MDYDGSHSQKTSQTADDDAMSDVTSIAERIMDIPTFHPSSHSSGFSSNYIDLNQHNRYPTYNSYGSPKPQLYRPYQRNYQRPPLNQYKKGVRFFKNGVYPNRQLVIRDGVTYTKNANGNMLISLAAKQRYEKSKTISSNEQGIQSNISDNNIQSSINADVQNVFKETLKSYQMNGFHRELRIQNMLFSLDVNERNGSMKLVIKETDNKKTNLSSLPFGVKYMGMNWIKLNKHAKYYLNPKAQSLLRGRTKFCQFFRFGKCKYQFGSSQQGIDAFGETYHRCRYIHDKRHLTICNAYLNKECKSGSCILSHKPTEFNMPLCKSFALGTCSLEKSNKCPYIHQHNLKFDRKLAKKLQKSKDKIMSSDKSEKYDNIITVQAAYVCLEFALEAYCENGKLCPNKHLYICPSFQRFGICLPNYLYKINNDELSPDIELAEESKSEECGKTCMLSHDDIYNSRKDIAKTSKDLEQPLWDYSTIGSPKYVIPSEKDLSFEDYINDARKDTINSVATSPLIWYDDSYQNAAIGRKRSRDSNDMDEVSTAAEYGDNIISHSPGGSILTPSDIKRHGDFDTLTDDGIYADDESKDELNGLLDYQKNISFTSLNSIDVNRASNFSMYNDSKSTEINDLMDTIIPSSPTNDADSSNGKTVIIDSLLYREHIKSPVGDVHTHGRFRSKRRKTILENQSNLISDTQLKQHQDHNPVVTDREYDGDIGGAEEEDLEDGYEEESKLLYENIKMSKRVKSRKSKNSRNELVYIASTSSRICKQEIIEHSNTIEEEESLKVSDADDEITCAEDEEPHRDLGKKSRKNRGKHVHIMKRMLEDNNLTDSDFPKLQEMNQSLSTLNSEKIPQSIFNLDEDDNDDDSEDDDSNRIKMDEATEKILKTLDKDYSKVDDVKFNIDPFGLNI